jgi:hemoglobin
LFFRVDDFDMALKRARALTRLEEEPHVNPNTQTREFSLRDPDGYHVTISALSEPMSENPPTLYEWLGGQPALVRLMERFYERVREDAMLAPIFAEMSAEHPQHVAAFLAEVFGGPADYSASHGGHPRMVERHLHRRLTQAQRRAWVALLLDTADEVNIPDDPEFRSALVAYLEWGSRLAVINSQPGAVVDPESPMPKWGWGEVKGPYRPDD